MNIAFVLPRMRNKSIGGYKMVYEYANRFTKMGHQVSIGYISNKVGKEKAAQYHIPEWGRRLLAYPISEWRMSHYPTWFQLSPRVKQFCIYDLSEKIDEADAIVATAFNTAEFVSKQHAPVLAYFIQGYETWDGVTKEEVHHTYQLGMRNIVITHWLENIVRQEAPGAFCAHVPNGLDLAVFHRDDKIKKEDHSVAMLYHDAPYKGSVYGIESLKILKRAYPDLKATLFGVPNRPSDLPDWITYVKSANQEQLVDIYNRAAVYMYPTIQEGLGLTCIESMACGCALAVSDYEAAHEFAVHEKTALLSPVRDPQAMAENVARYFDDPDFRMRVAQEGMETAKQFDWNLSVKRFLKVLEP